jgi:hypothetical protein
MRVYYSNAIDVHSVTLDGGDDSSMIESQDRTKTVYFFSCTIIVIPISF